MISIILATILTIVGGLILLYICINILGMVVRGLYFDKKILKTQLAGENDTDQEIEAKVKDFLSPKKTIAWIIVSVLLYGLLYLSLGILGVVSALLIMIGRLPDLLWEIKHGRKISSEDRYSPFLYFSSTILGLVAFPVLWLSIYYLLT